MIEGIEVGRSVNAIIDDSDVLIAIIYWGSCDGRSANAVGDDDDLILMVVMI